MKRILFDVTTSTQLALARETARRAKSAGFAPALCYSGDEAAAACEQTKRAAEELGCELFDFAAAQREPFVLTEPEPPPPPKLLDRWLSRFSRHKDPWRTVTEAPKYRLWTEHVQRQASAASAVIRNAAPRAVVVGEDGVSGNGALVAAARAAGVPTIVCPYELSGREDFDNYIEEKQRDGDLLTVGNAPEERVLRRRYGHWIRRTKHGRAVIFPPHFILAREAAGWSMPDPWTTHGGGADYLAVECPATLVHYRREGLPKAKLQLLGSPYCDVLADVLADHPQCAEARRRRTKIVAGRTSILISLPPSYHETRPGTNEFGSYEEMCRNVIEACRRIPNVDCTLSIHPATSPEQRSMLEGFGLPVASEWILKLIPRHDLLITSFSSVIRWAVACGKPVLNYDAYAFKLAVYKRIKTVLTRRSLSELKADLVRLADDAEYARLAASLGADDRWGRLDGGNTRRILEFISQQSIRQPVPGVATRILNLLGKTARVDSRH